MQGTQSLLLLSFTRKDQSLRMSGGPETSSFSLLKNLPPGFASIYPFLDGKAMSTLHLALSVDKSEEAGDMRSCLNKSAMKRLERIPKQWQAHLNQIIAHSSNSDNSTTNGSSPRRSLLNQVRPSILKAINCFHQFQQYAQENGDRETCHHQTRILSEAMIMFHLFAIPYCNLKHLGTCQAGLLSSPRSLGIAPEWPIWCGKIQIAMWVPRGSFHGFERQILSANVILLSPTWDQIHFPAWHALGETGHDRRCDGSADNDDSIDTIQLIAESYNFLPTPPMGRLVGITTEDQGIINIMAHRMADQDTVAILSPAHRSVESRNRYIDSVRIISRSQAQQRISRMPSLPFSFYVKGNNAHYNKNQFASGDEDLSFAQGEELLCCWQYRDLFANAVVTTAQDCIPYWKHMALTRDQCLLQEEP